MAGDEPVSEETEVVGALVEVVGLGPVQREVAAQAEIGGETPQQLGHMVLLQGLWGRRGRQDRGGRWRRRSSTEDMK